MILVEEFYLKSKTGETSVYKKYVAEALTSKTAFSSTVKAAPVPVNQIVASEDAYETSVTFPIIVILFPSQNSCGFVEELFLSSVTVQLLIIVVPFLL